MVKNGTYLPTPETSGVSMLVELILEYRPPRLVVQVKRPKIRGGAYLTPPGRYARKRGVVTHTFPRFDVWLY